MSKWKEFGERAAQEIGQRAVQSVINNPKTAIATGVATAKTVGGCIATIATTLAPYAAGAAIGIGIVWGVSKLLDD